MLAMLLGLVVVPVVSFCTKVENREKVEKMFGCYTHTVTVPASDSLTENSAQ